MSDAQTERLRAAVERLRDETRNLSNHRQDAVVQQWMLAGGWQAEAVRWLFCSEIKRFPETNISIP